MTFVADDGKLLPRPSSRMTAPLGVRSGLQNGASICRKAPISQLYEEDGYGQAEDEARACRSDSRRPGCTSGSHR